MPPGIASVAIGPLSLIATAKFIPSFSWPRILSRALIGMIAGKPHFSQVWFNELGNSSYIGPVSYYLIGQAISLFNKDLAQKYFDRAIEVLSVDGFSKDVKFISSIVPLSEIISHTLISLKNICKDGFIDTIGYFNPDSMQILKNLVKKLQDLDSSESIENLIKPALTDETKEKFKAIIPK